MTEVSGGCAVLKADPNTGKKRTHTLPPSPPPPPDPPRTPNALCQIPACLFLPRKFLPPGSANVALTSLGEASFSNNKVRIPCQVLALGVSEAYFIPIHIYPMGPYPRLPDFIDGATEGEIFIYLYILLVFRKCLCLLEVKAREKTHGGLGCPSKQPGTLGAWRGPGG